MLFSNFIKLSFYKQSACKNNISNQIHGINVKESTYFGVKQTLKAMFFLHSLIRTNSALLISELLYSDIIDRESQDILIDIFDQIDTKYSNKLIEMIFGQEILLDKAHCFKQACYELKPHLQTILNSIKSAQNEKK